MEQWISSATVYEGKIFDVRTGTVRLDDGQTARRDVVVNPGGVAVVPLIGNELILIRQFRIAVGKIVVELPAGRLESGEQPAYTAGRELQEELGFAAGRLIPLSRYYSSVGFSTEEMHIFLATDLVPVEHRPEWDEQVEPFRVPVTDLAKQLALGRFDDAKTIIGLSAFLRHVEQYPEILSSDAQ